MVIAANGVAMPGAFFAHVMKDYSYAFERFQIEQAVAGSMMFRYVPASRHTPKVLEQVEEIFRRYLGADMQIHIEAVDHIPMVRTGKFQTVVNHMDLNYQEFQNVFDPRDATDG
jgi:hypothetical protein